LFLPRYLGLISCCDYSPVEIRPMPSRTSQGWSASNVAVSFILLADLLESWISGRAEVDLTG